jgi:hypothetical protein
MIQATIALQQESLRVMILATRTFTDFINNYTNIFFQHFIYCKWENLKFQVISPKIQNISPMSANLMGSSAQKFVNGKL